MGVDIPFGGAIMAQTLSRPLGDSVRGIVILRLSSAKSLGFDSNPEVRRNPEVLGTASRNPARRADPGLSMWLIANSGREADAVVSGFGQVSGF